MSSSLEREIMKSYPVSVPHCCGCGFSIGFSAGSEPLLQADTGTERSDAVRLHSVIFIGILFTFI